MSEQSVITLKCKELSVAEERTSRSSAIAGTEVQRWSLGRAVDNPSDNGE